MPHQELVSRKKDVLFPGKNIGVMANLAQTKILAEIHISNFLVLMVIHHCTSFKKILKADLKNQEFDGLGPILR